MELKRTLTILATTGLLVALPPAGSTAWASPIPSTTDEARALAGSGLPERGRPSVPATVSSTDDARALAGAALREQPCLPARALMASIPSSTDEARADAGARIEQAAGCGTDVAARSPAR